MERHVHKQLYYLYYDIVLQKCLLERKVLRNLLSLAVILLADFAYNLMEGPGYMTVVIGEVVRVIKYIPVPVIVRIPDPQNPRPHKKKDGISLQRHNPHHIQNSQYLV